MRIDLTTIRGLEAHQNADTELRAHLEEVNTAANGQAFTDEQRADFEETRAAIDELAPIIDELALRTATLEAMSGNERNLVRPTFGGAPAARKVVPEDPFNLTGYRERVRSIDDLGAAYIDGARAALEKIDFPTIDRAKGQQQIDDLLSGRRLAQGEPADVALQMLRTGSPRYRAAWGKYVGGGFNVLNDDERRALQTGSDGNGGIAIPFTIDPTFILTSDGQANPFRKIARVVPITTKAWQPVTTGGLTASYGTETATTTDAAPTDFEGPEITPVECKVVVKFTSTYGEDYGLAALTGEVGRLVQDAKDNVEANKFAQGNGSNEPEGIIWFLDDDGTSLVPIDAWNLDALDEITGELPERFQSNATAVAHRKNLQRARSFGTAGQPADTIFDAINKRLYGYPAEISSAMDGTAEPGDEPLLVGDFRYFVIVDRLGLATEFVPNLVDSNGQLTGQRGILARWRNTSKVLTPNAFRLGQVY
jgi:HK97 family phage major capsid protein